jgi:hypothetical protein
MPRTLTLYRFTERLPEHKQKIYLFQVREWDQWVTVDPVAVTFEREPEPLLVADEWVSGLDQESYWCPMTDVESLGKREVAVNEKTCPECKGKCCRNYDTSYRVVHLGAEIGGHVCDYCLDGSKIEESTFSDAHARKALGNLLAVIHGDGGHTIDRLGWEEACKTAEAKVVEMFSARDRVKS